MSMNHGGQLHLAIQIGDIEIDLESDTFASFMMTEMFGFIDPICELTVFDPNNEFPGLG